jgi:hypothetical protein
MSESLPVVMILIGLLAGALGVLRGAMLRAPGFVPRGRKHAQPQAPLSPARVATSRSRLGVASRRSRRCRPASPGIADERIPAGALARSGVLFRLLGLLTGVAIPVVRAGIALGPHRRDRAGSRWSCSACSARGSRSDGWAAAIAHGLYLAVRVVARAARRRGLRTGKTLPIAGAGLRARPWQETTAFALISAGSLGSAAAVAALLWQWSWRSV